MAVVGLTKSADQWSEVEIFVPAPAGDAQKIDRWSKLVTAALSAQRDVSEVKRLVRQSGFLEFRIVADRERTRTSTSTPSSAPSRPASPTTPPCGAGTP